MLECRSFSRCLWMRMLFVDWMMWMRLLEASVLRFICFKPIDNKTTECRNMESRMWNTWMERHRQGGCGPFRALWPRGLCSGWVTFGGGLFVDLIDSEGDLATNKGVPYRGVHGKYTTNLQATLIIS